MTETINCIMMWAALIALIGIVGRIALRNGIDKTINKIIDILKGHDDHINHK